MWHGTGYYNNNVSHVSIAMLLTKNIQYEWERFKTRVDRSELQEQDLLLYLEENGEDEIY